MNNWDDFIERLDDPKSDGWIAICLVVIAFLWVSVILSVLLAPV